MSATTPRPNRRARRLAARARRGEQPMSRPVVSKEEAINKLRAQIAPEQYLKSLTDMREVYLSRAAELLGNRDLTAASNRTDPRDVEMVNIQFDEALVDLNWRVETINERIADFEATKKDITRPFDRQPDAPEDAVQPAEEFPEATVVEESALAASLTDEQRADVEQAVAESQPSNRPQAATQEAALSEAEQARVQAQGPPPESIDEIAARRAQVEGQAIAEAGEPTQPESED